MNRRITMAKAAPAGNKALIELDKYIESTQLSVVHKDLIKIRASQINGCAYCISMHTHDARKNGETEQRIYLLNAWKETDLYTPDERAILALTEEMTLLTEHGVSDAVYNEAAALFSEEYLGEAMMAIININAWNRVGVSLQMKPAVING